MFKYSFATLLNFITKVHFIFYEFYFLIVNYYYNI